MTDTNADINARNQELDARNMATWATSPDHFAAYYEFPNHQSGGQWRREFYPCNTGARVTSWMGANMGAIIKARVTTNNFRARVVSLTVRSVTGATYHGRASWDRGNLVSTMCV